MNKINVLVAAVSVALFAVPAFAQDAAPTLRVEQGTVMTSTGGEFVSAASGKLLAEGERVMVGEGASASVVYANGCAYDYAAPGVYAVPAVCTGGGAGQSGTHSNGVDWAEVGIIAGAAGVAAVALDQMGDDDDNEPAPPVSR